MPRTGQIRPPLDFLAEFTQHIPAKGAHLIRYYGWYSNKSRGMRKKAAEAAGTAEEVENSSASVGEEQASSSCSHQSWAMLIKRVYEADPLTCPQCGGQMAVVTFIEPPQADVIERILRHCGLRRCSAARAPPANAGSGPVHRTASPMN